MNLDDICSFVNSEFSSPSPKHERMMKDDPIPAIAICMSLGLQYNGSAETVIALGQSPPAHGLATMHMVDVSFACKGAKEN